MPAYCLFDNLKINDYQKLERYRNAAAPIVQKFGGRYVVIGGHLELKEGHWKPNFPVMIEFPTLERANEWYNSEEYRPLKALRESAGTYNAVFFEELRSPGSAV